VVAFDKLKILPMKRRILLAVASLIGAGALTLWQVSAADPDPSSTSSPQESPAVKPPPPPDPQNSRGGDQFHERPNSFQRGDHRWGRHGDRFGDWRMLDRLLNLTDEQKEKVKEIMAANKPRIKAIHEEQRAKIHAVVDDIRQQIRPLLTPDQQKVFDDAQKLRQDARKLREEARALRQEKQSSQCE
jgi:Spy/CpxP family protein refolding chaperone